MRIALQVEGGIASFPGLRRPVTLDSATLPAARAAQLAALVHRADFFAAPEPAAAPAGGADLRTYVLTIEDGARTRTLCLAEPIADAAMRDLVSEIRACVRDARG
jgi:hypothetical protein